MFGSDDPAIECLCRGLGMGGPVLLGVGFGCRSDSGEAAPMVPFTSPHCQLGAVLGGPVLLARVGELAGSLAGGGVDPRAGSVVEVVAGSAEPIKVGACRYEVGPDAGRAALVDCGQLHLQPRPLGFGICGEHPHIRVDARLGGAGDPFLAAIDGPVVGDVLDGLVEVVGDGVDDARLAGA
jgi:hypothetical protein